MRKKKIISLVSASIAMSLGIIGIFIHQSHVVSAENDPKNVLNEIKNEYIVGTTIDIPDVYFTDENDKIKGTKVVVYPDSKEYSLDSFTPSEMGKYKIKYFAKTSSGYQEESKEIYIYKDLYEVTGKASKVSYGSHAQTPNVSGINVSLGAGDKFLFNKVIDLNNLGNEPFISMYLTPEIMGELDVLEFNVILTDAYDPTNYIVIRVNSAQDSRGPIAYLSYLSAGAAFQPLVGYSATENRYYENENFGFPQQFTFYGCDTGRNQNEALITSKGKTGQLQLFFDTIAKSVRTQSNLAGYSEITDFDNPKFYTKLWDGFTTGEVFLSITSNSVAQGKSHFNFVATSIAGNDLVSNKLIDNDKPIINTNTEGYDELPHAVLNKPYEIFDAYSLDAYSGYLDVTANVYMNYGGALQTNVNVVDGKFIPKNYGTYFIVYSAKDYSGNVGEKVLITSCEEKHEPINLTIDESSKIVEASVGQYVALPNATATGGNGKIDIQIEVKHEDGTVIELDNNSFTPEKAGKYTIKYIASDYNDITDELSYELNAVLSNKPVFAGDLPQFEKYYIAGYEYEIPTYKAYDYTNGKKEIPVITTISDDNGIRNVGSDRKVTFNVQTPGATRTFTVNYEASGFSGTATKSFDVKVISPKQLIDGNQRLDISKYFYPTNANIKADENGMNITATKDGGVEFINYLLASSFGIDFATINSSKFENIKITLIDSINSNEKVEVLLSRGEGKLTNVKINGFNYSDIDKAFNKSDFEFTYNQNNNTISLDSKVYFTVVKENGETFNGFSSNKVSLFIDLVGVSDESTIVINKINAQNMSSATVLDRVSPRIAIINEQDSRIRSVGDIVTAYGAVGADVIDPKVSVTMTVSNPNNKPVTSIDGVKLLNISADTNYQFEITEYGNYRILYKSTDNSNNEASISTFIRILDTEKPVITLKRPNISSAKLNDVIVVAPYEVIDNVTTQENLYANCYVITPSGYMFTLDMKNSNSFVANEVGVYKIRYMAFDENSNVSLVENKILVGG